MKVLALLLTLSVSAFGQGEKPSGYGRNAEVDEACKCDYCQGGVKPECRGTFYSRDRVEGKNNASTIKNEPKNKASSAVAQ